MNEDEIRIKAMLRRDRMLFFGLILLVIIMVFLLISIRSDGYKCVKDPVQYGVDKMSKVTGHEISCTCSDRSNPFATKQVMSKNWDKG